MFENRIKRGEISSAQIVEELESDGYNLHGLERRRFMVDGLGLTIIRSYPIGRDSILIFKRKDWLANKRKIVGKTRFNAPILEGAAVVMSGTHDRKTARPVIAASIPNQATVEEKVDLLLWAVNEMLEQQARYA